MMNFKNPYRHVLTALLSTCVTLSANATTDSAVINISHTYTPFVSLTGTAPGANRYYSNSELTFLGAPIPVNLGTMGLESNIGGTCDLNFTTENNFKLLHTIIPNKNLGDYNILYKGIEFNNTNNPLLQLACTSAATNIDFELDAAFSLSSFDIFLESGHYRDVVTVTVTTQ